MNISHVSVSIKAYSVFRIDLPFASLSLSLSSCQQALEEVLQSEREAGLKEVRACAAAAEVASTAASNRAVGGAEVDPRAAVSSRKMKVGKNTSTARERVET